VFTGVPRSSTLGPVADMVSVMIYVAKSPLKLSYLQMISKQAYIA